MKLLKVLSHIFRKNMQNQLKIGTHNGSFHCDEALACAMLTNYSDKFKGATIIRTRNPQQLSKCDIVVDVGGKYQPPFLLDHHQRQFQGTYPNYDIRLSSAGLVYMHYPEIIPNIIKQIIQKEGKKLTFQPIQSQDIIAKIRESIYKNLIIYVDANDNGIDKINDKQISRVPTTLWARVAKINPMWWQQSPQQDKCFHQALKIVHQELYAEVRHAFLGSIQTTKIVAEQFNKRKTIHDSGKIMLMEKYVPWQKALVQLQEEHKCVGQVLFVLFPDKSGQGYRIQAVSLKDGSFQLRKGLKQQWRGVKDMEKLKQLSKINDIVFVHASGFIGGAKSLQSTIRMGIDSL